MSKEQVVPIMDQSTGESAYSTTASRINELGDTSVSEEENDVVEAVASNSSKSNSPIPKLNLEDVAGIMSQQALQTAVSELADEDLVRSAIAEVSTDFVSGDMTFNQSEESDADTGVSENGSTIDNVNVERNSYQICEPWSDQDNAETWSCVSTPLATPRVKGVGVMSASDEEGEIRLEAPATPKVLPQKYFTAQENVLTPTANSSIPFQSETPKRVPVHPMSHSTPFIPKERCESAEMVALEPDDEDTTFGETSYEEIPANVFEKRPETQGSEADLDEKETTLTHEIKFIELSPAEFAVNAGMEDYVPAEEREKLLKEVQAEMSKKYNMDALERDQFKPTGASDAESDVTDYVGVPSKITERDPVRCTAQTISEEYSSDRSNFKRKTPTKEINESSCSSTQYHELPGTVVDLSHGSALKDINDSLGDTICKEIEDFLAQQEPTIEDYHLTDSDLNGDNNDDDDSVAERVNDLLMRCEKDRSYENNSSETLVPSNRSPGHSPGPIRLTRSHSDISSYEKFSLGVGGDDSLTEKVRRLLAESEQICRDSSPCASPTVIHELVHSISAPINVSVYQDLQKDLDEINTSLRQYREELRKVNMSPESQASCKSIDTVKTSSDLDYEKNKKLQWDYAADIGEIALPEFLSSKGAAQAKAESQKDDVARSRSPLNDIDINHQQVQRILTMQDNPYQGSLTSRVNKLLENDSPQRHAYNILREAEEREMEDQMGSLEEEQLPIKIYDGENWLSRVSERITPKSPRPYEPLHPTFMSPSKRERAASGIENQISPSKRSRVDEDSILNRLKFSPLVNKPFLAFDTCRNLLSEQMQKMNERRSLDFGLRSPVKTKIDTSRSAFQAADSIRNAVRTRSLSPKRQGESSAEVSRYMSSYRSAHDVSDIKLFLRKHSDHESPINFTDKPYVSASHVKSLETIMKGTGSANRNIVPVPPVINKENIDSDDDIPSVTPRNQDIIGSDTDGQHVRLRKPRSISPSIRPYRPPGSTEVYYIERNPEDGSTGVSGLSGGETTLESTHLGSDDAQPPYLPAQALGSRTESVPHINGIYSGHPVRMMEMVEEEKDLNSSLQSVEKYFEGNKEKLLEGYNNNDHLLSSSYKSPHRSTSEDQFTTPEKVKNIHKRTTSKHSEMMPLQPVVSSSEDEIDVLQSSGRPKTSLQILQDVLEKESNSSLNGDLDELWLRYKAKRISNYTSLSIVDRIKRLREALRRQTNVHNVCKNRHYCAVSDLVNSKAIPSNIGDDERSDTTETESQICSERSESTIESQALRLKMKAILETDTLLSIPEGDAIDSQLSDVTLLPAKLSDPKLLILKMKIKEQKEKHKKDKQREEKRLEKIEKLENILHEKKMGHDVSDSSVSHTISTTTNTTAMTTSDEEFGLSTQSTSSTDSTITPKQNICICNGKKENKNFVKYLEKKNQDKIIEQLQAAKTCAGHVIEHQKNGNWYLEFGKPKKQKSDLFLEMEKRRSSNMKKKDSEPIQMRNKKVQADLESKKISHESNRRQKKTRMSSSDKENHKQKKKTVQNCPLSSNVIRRSVSPKCKTESVQTSPALLRRLDQQAPPSKMFSPEKKIKARKAKPVPMCTDSSLCWYVPVHNERPWKMPIKQRQILSEMGQFPSIPKGPTLEDVELIADKDPDIEFFLHNDKLIHKPASVFDNEGKKITLQEALAVFKNNFISRCRERQKRIKLASKEREIQAHYKKQRELLFTNATLKDPNLDAHPYSENLYKPKYRVMTKKEMKELTDKVYMQLPEVVEKKDERKRIEEYKTNRVRAQMYNQRVLDRILNRYSDV